MSAAQFKAYECFQARFQDTTIKLTIYSCTVYFGGANFETVASATVVGSSLAPIKALIDKCMPGTSISFDNVKVNTKNDGVRVIEGGTILLY